MLIAVHEGHVFAVHEDYQETKVLGMYAGMEIIRADVCPGGGDPDPRTLGIPADTVRPAG